MRLNGEIVAALSNWQGVAMIAVTLVAAVAWRGLRHYFRYSSN